MRSARAMGLLGAALLAAVACKPNDSPPPPAAAPASASAASTAAPTASTPPPPLLPRGEKAPDFSLQGSDGKTHALADHAGKQVVVIAWFPKAFTSG